MNRNTTTIITHESAIIDMCHDVERLIAEVKSEPVLADVERDYMGTLHVNVVVLANRLRDLQRALEARYGFQKVGGR